jgi:5-(hydroxymethyl)furfural/furfural oxidase
MVRRLVFDGRRAVGVVVTIDGQEQEFRAQETILSTGAIQSPTLLMRAGIGPATSLRDNGIEVRADLAGVGRNLSNHALLFLAIHLKREGRQAESLRPHPTTVLRYSSGVPTCPRTDMYINIQSKTSWSELGHQIANLAPVLWKPLARGRVTLAAADERVMPRVEFNFSGHELDLVRLMGGFRRAVEMLMYEKVRAIGGITFPVKFTDRLRRLNQFTLPNKAKSAAIGRLLDLVPALGGPVFATLADRRVDLATLSQDDDALADHIRENVAGMFHVAGTCRMGRAHDPDAVVDPTGVVRGVGGLRVVDASIMPTVPRANTNIPTIMLAEKISAAILDDARATAA